MKKIIQFFLLLVFFTFQINASANSIPAENIDSLPDLSAQANTDLVYDYTTKKLIWVNRNLTTTNLAKSRLSTLSSNNPFAYLPSNPSAALQSITPSKTGKPTLSPFVSLTNPLSVVISHLNTSQISPIIQAVPVPAPSSIWLVIIGLFGLIRQPAKSSSDYNNKPLKQPKLIKLPTNTSFNVSSLLKKIISYFESKSSIKFYAPHTLIFNC